MQIKQHSGKVIFGPINCLRDGSDSHKRCIDCQVSEGVEEVGITDAQPG